MYGHIYLQVKWNAKGTIVHKCRFKSSVQRTQVDGNWTDQWYNISVNIRFSQILICWRFLCVCVVVVAFFFFIFLLFLRQLDTNVFHMGAVIFTMWDLSCLILEKNSKEMFLFFIFISFMSCEATGKIVDASSKYKLWTMFLRIHSFGMR